MKTSMSVDGGKDCARLDETTCEFIQATLRHKSDLYGPSLISISSHPRSWSEVNSYMPKEDRHSHFCYPPEWVDTFVFYTKGAI